MSLSGRDRYKNLEKIEFEKVHLVITFDFQLTSGHDPVNSFSYLSYSYMCCQWN